MNKELEKRKIVKFKNLSTPRFLISNSFTLIEVLVGVALMLIVFLGIFGVYQLGFKVVGLNERKITATQIAQGEIEKIRNIPYLNVGTIGASLPNASGTLPADETKILNRVEYKIERKIQYIVDSADGNFPEDICDLDYKKVEILVSWTGSFEGEIKMVTDISPKNETEETQICFQEPVGALKVLVFDALGNFIPSPLIEVYNPSSGLLEASAIPSDGIHSFPLSPGNYKLVVSKNGYSKEETFTIGDVYQGKTISTPQNSNPIVLEGQTTQISLQIDKLSSFLVKTLTPWGTEYFFDSFLDESKISEKTNLAVSDGKVELATTSGGYLSAGYLISTEIFPTNLINWGEFSFADQELENTDLKYQIYYASGTEWILIPDSDLGGNSIGFDLSPVNLSNLATTTYSKLKLKANFSTNASSSSPTLFDWQVFWKNGQATPISNVQFNLRGEKLVGKDINEEPIYKFSTTTQTNSSGQIQIQGLEWDIYHFSNFQKDSQGLELSTSTPDHPISLSPETNLEVLLYLEAQNSLLVTVQDFDTLEPIFSATTTLSKNGYQNNQYTNERGQTLFIPLDVGNYNLLVEALGYFSTSTTVYVLGKSTKEVKLQIAD